MNANLPALYCEGVLFWLTIASQFHCSRFPVLSSFPDSLSPKARAFLIGLALFLVVNGWFVANLDKRPELRAVAQRPDLQGALSLVSAVFVVGFALPSFWILWRFLGPKRGALTLLALSLFAVGIETFAVKTGVPYGRFQYGPKIGGKLFDAVPWTVPFAWTPLLLGAMQLSWRAGRVWWKTLLSAALWLTFFDLVLDPGAVSQKFWAYLPPGAYYGVPLSNYGGWLLSGVIGAGVFMRLSGLTMGSQKLPRALLISSFLILTFWTSVCLCSSLSIPAVIGAFLVAYLGRALLWRPVSL